MSAQLGQGRRPGGRGCAFRADPVPGLLLIVLGLLLVGCAARVTPATETQAAPTAPATPRSTATPRAGVTLSPPATPAALTALTIWGPDMMAPLQDAPGGDVLAAQIAAFSEAHSGLEVRYQRKKPYGQGGLVHLLRSTQAVAPASLPDLVLLDMREIGLLAGTGLLQPLEPLLPPDLIADLVPFAREAGQVGEHLLAVQYEADIRFLAYNSAIVYQPPATWAELLAYRSTYLLPLGRSEGAVRDAFLPQYVALGGKLTDRDGHPYLDRTVAAAVLEMYVSARQANVLPSVGLDLKDASDCWPIYLSSGRADAPARDAIAMTNVTSWDYGRERARLIATRAAPLPTLSGTLISLSNGWGWALIAQDSGRQAAAVAFLQWILKPESMASWSQATYHLPTRRSALALAIDDPDYARFIQRLMEVAVPQPREPLYTLAVEALGPAIEAVARGRMTPQAAAAEAADKMQATQGQTRIGPQS